MSRPLSDNVSAGYTISGNTATYWFESMNDTASSGGKPGLRELCVYLIPDPTSEDAVAIGDDGTEWNVTENFAGGNFHHLEYAPDPSGDPGNIPYDGANVTIGSATWSNGAPTNQTILLHIYDPAECARLGQVANTCFVLPDNENFTKRKTPPFVCFNVEGTKYEDSNGNGVLDQGELGLSGWTINLFLDGEEENSTVTGSDGTYLMRVCAQGDYSVEEVLQAGWTQTGEDLYEFTATSGENQTGLDFLNFENVDISACKYNDEAGDGVKGAGDAVLSGWTMNLYRGATLVSSKVTNSTGCVLWSDLGPGSYTVTEDLQTGWTATLGTSHSLGSATSGDDLSTYFLNFEMFDISGHKYEDMNGDGDREAGDDGIEGWRITVCPGVGTDTCTSTETAADGSWSMGPLGPGTYTVTEEDQAGWTHTTTATLGFDGSSGDDVTGLDFLNFENIDVSACKYEDENGDGEGVEDGALSGWTMNLYRGTTLVSSKDTGDNGCTSWTDLGPGSYTVTEDVLAGWTATSGTSHSLGSATSGDDLSTYFLNFENFRLSGTKYEDENGDGSSAGDSGLGGWLVELRLWVMAHTELDAVALTTTASDGSWSFSNIPPGEYRVCESMQSGWTATSVTCYEVTGESGAHFSGLDFLNFEKFTISGTKFNDANGDGSSDGDSGIEGWGVELWLDDAMVDSTTTDADGAYSFGPLGPGTYTVYEETRDGWVATGVFSYGVPGTSGEDVVSVDFTNFEMFSICGTKFVDANGDGETDGDSGLPGWGVALVLDDEIVGEGVTGGDGTYCFDELGPGAYTVIEESRDGWIPTTATSHEVVGVSGTDVGGQDFANFELFGVSGTKFEDMNGDGASTGDSALEGWGVKLCDADAVCQETTTDETGSYSFTGLGPGSYTVFEETRDGWVATGEVSFGFDGASGVDQVFDFLNFELGKICGLKFLDADHNGEYANGVELGIEGIVIKLWLGSQLVATTTTGSSGHFCFEDLEAGTYTVTEELPDNADSNMVWAQTAPEGGSYTFTVTSGFATEDALFGNVCEYIQGLTWGYWKTHTGEAKNGPRKDGAYDLLADNPMLLDITTVDGDYLLENAKEAYAILKKVDTSASCSGDCRTLFRVQLIALYMNTLKYSDIGGQTFAYAGDDYDGWTVDEILAEGIDLLTDGASHDFGAIMSTVDLINNNGHYSTGEHVLVCTHA